MAGISNPAYMRICEEMGCSYAITELISSEAVIRNNKKTFDMLNGIEDLNIPVAIQLFGSNPDTMANAAKILVDKYHCAIIDLNFGCPVPKVALHSNAGSGLLKDVDKIYDIVSSVVKKVNIPVTAKIRSGWDMNNINAVEVAKICEKAGAAAICIHPRTRSQGYSGFADWNIIKEVKINISIPVIGNGDIKTPEDAKRMLEETKCDAIMIGRAILGNPWLIKQTVEYLEEGTYNNNISASDKIEMCLKHLEYLRKYKVEKLAALEIRNHIAWYLKGLKNSTDIKNKVYKTTTIDDIINILNEYRKEFNVYEK